MDFCATLTGEATDRSSAYDDNFTGGFHELDFDIYLNDLEELFPSSTDDKDLVLTSTSERTDGKYTTGKVTCVFNTHLTTVEGQSQGENPVATLHKRTVENFTKKGVNDGRQTKVAKLNRTSDEDHDLERFKRLLFASQSSPNENRCATHEKIVERDSGNNCTQSEVKSITTMNPNPLSPRRFSDESIIDYARRVAAAFNIGDLDRLNSLIDEHMIEGFLIRTPFAPDPLVGRNHFKDICAAVMTDRPDTVYSVSYSKIVRDKKSRERYLAVKFEFVQTRCSFLTDKLDKMDEHYVSMPELHPHDQLELKQREFVRSKTPYKAMGCKWLRYTLNDDNEMIECNFATKLTSVEAFDISAINIDGI